MQLRVGLNMRVSISFTIILLILPALALGQQCSIPGECLGTHLETEFFDTERECLDYCKTVEGCEWYSYDSSIGHCNVLADCTETNLDCSTCVHGENECDLLLCFVTGECSGGYIGHVVVPSADECLLTCHNEPECNFFSFYEERSACNLYETCSLDESETDVISGERGCYQGALPESDGSVGSGNAGGGFEAAVGADGFGSTKIFVQLNTDTAWIHMPSLHESGTSCNQPAPYPLSTDSTTGQVVNGTMTVCGGFLTSQRRTCFSLDAVLNLWVEFPSMDVGRYDAASVLTPAGWWVTGGSDSSFLSSTSIWDGSTWQSGANLPSAREDHCMVQVNSSHTFMAGGLYGSDLSDSYLFDWSSRIWIPLPDMPEGLGGLACTVYRDNDGGEHILVAAGRPGSGEERLVRSIDLASPTRWDVLPQLPVPASFSEFVHDGEDVILVNQDGGSLLLFNKTSLEFSVIPDQEVPHGTVGTLVLAISDATLSGCA